jgi:hypothetical protein
MFTHFNKLQRKLEARRVVERASVFGMVKPDSEAMFASLSQLFDYGEPKKLDVNMPVASILT